MLSNQLNWDELVAADIAGFLSQSSQVNPPITTPLLDCHQWIPLTGAHNWQATGGFFNAQFRCLHQPDATPQLQYWQANAANLPPNAQQARGLRRLFTPQLPSCSLGDIVVAAGKLSWVALPGCAELFGQYGARPLQAWPALTTQQQRTTVASLRLDAVTGAIFHTSREEVQTAIEYGFIFLNFIKTSKRSKQLQVGDTLVFRGKGRAIIAGCLLNDRSKRYWLDYELFPY